MQETGDRRRAASKQAAGDQVHGPEAADARRLASDELLAGAKEVLIEHEGDLYRLRCTSKGKLILTK